MGNTNKPQVQEPQKVDKIENTTSVSVKMKPEEKSLLIQKAVKESGLSVSEFIRYKLFDEKPVSLESKETDNFDVIEDEERQAYEQLIKEQRTAIADLTQELYRAKSKNIDLSEKDNENACQLSEDNSEFVDKLLSDEGKKVLLKKRGLFGGKYETDLSQLTETDIINASVNFIKELFEDNEMDFQRSFNEYFSKDK